MGESKTKVAILGGGVGAMTAAFALTQTPQARQKYDVTVYQMGWRLGGKGASGRRADDGQRIEEHGLHVWSGFYDNAIAQMKACLKELKDAGIDGTYHSFDEAFIPHGNIALGDDDGGWSFWPMRVPPNDAEPGTGGVYLSPWDYIAKLSRYLRQELEGGRAPLSAAQDPRTTLSRELSMHVDTRAGGPNKGLGDTALHWLETLIQELPADTSTHTPQDRAALTALADQLHADVRQSRVAEASAPEGLASDLHKAFIILDLGATVLRGMILDGVILDGFDAIDGDEISQWLARHGARAETINSPLVRAVYDYAFGFRHGTTDPTHRAIAAGIFLQGSLRLFFTYKGSIFFKMRAGMGDTIFTPYYKALKNRGVKFEFFQKVRTLKLDKTGEHIDRMVIDRQATPKTGAYDPLVRVKGLDCWPTEPFFDQLEEGAELQRRGINLESSWSDWAPVETQLLERGRDFDEVILGISIGALPEIVPELIAADPAWKRMVDKVETAATQAMQLWLRPTVNKLKWPHGDSILTAYADDINTWADMTHLDPTEDWPRGKKPGSIAYFCGPLADPDVMPPYSDTDFPARAKAQVMEASREWMRVNGPRLWPGAFDRDGVFDEAALISTLDPGAGGMWETQYFRANYEPTERYVLSVPGSTGARLRSDRSGFRNLWLAGDWTYTGINAGCVEAAAMSGLRAAAGLAGVPAVIVGEPSDGSVTDVLRPGPTAPPMAPVLESLRPQNSSWPWSAAYGMAQTTGPLVMLRYPRERVQALLPEGLTLADQTMTGPGEHPVMLLFGRQRGVRPNMMPFGMNYNEFIFSVPMVRHADPALADLPPMLFPVQLYLDNVLPIKLGIYGYGFPKKRAAMQVDATSYIVRDLDTDEEIISCSFSHAGPKVAARDIPNFAHVRPAYETPMITRNLLGQWQYSVYDLSLGQALLQPLDLRIRISSEHLGLPQGDISLSSIDQSPFGGVFLTCDATINNPMQSGALRRLLWKGSE